jgi:hypothetical protein
MELRRMTSKKPLLRDFSELLHSLQSDSTPQNEKLPSGNLANPTGAMKAQIDP